MRTELSDGRIRIRRSTVDDAATHHEAAVESIAEVRPWLPWLHDGYTVEESRTWLATCSQDWDHGRFYDFVIEDVSTVWFLGAIGLNAISQENRSANMGYWVRTSATGRGVATAAARLCARFGLDGLGLVRIQITADVENVASQRVAEKVGAVREGIHRNNEILHGVARDSVCFSIIPGDLK